jgi:hypothetical protein
VTPQPNIIGTEDAKGFLRALKGGIYPPSSLMLTHIMDRGVFSLGTNILVRKWPKEVAKNTQNALCPKSGPRCDFLV